MSCHAVLCRLVCERGESGHSYCCRPFAPFSGEQEKRMLVLYIVRPYYFRQRNQFGLCDSSFSTVVACPRWTLVSDCCPIQQRPGRGSV